MEEKTKCSFFPSVLLSPCLSTKHSAIVLFEINFDINNPEPMVPLILKQTLKSYQSPCCVYTQTTIFDANNDSYCTTNSFTLLYIICSGNFDFLVKVAELFYLAYIKISFDPIQNGEAYQQL